MGAALIGHICVGPKEPSAENVSKAREHAKCVLAQFEQATALIEKEGEDAVADVIEKRFPEIVKVAKQAGYDDLVDFVGLQVTGQYGPDEFVTECLNMWEHREPYRDVMSRDFIDPQSGVVDPDYQILVAGERSWGDGPYENSGWWLCERAAWLGIMDILGIW